jgi:hypothetical protein
MVSSIVFQPHRLFGRIGLLDERTERIATSLPSLFREPLRAVDVFLVRETPGLAVRSRQERSLSFVSARTVSVYLDRLGFIANSRLLAVDGDRLCD